MANKLSETLTKIERLPMFTHQWAKSLAIGMQVPFVGTAGLIYEKTDLDHWIVRIKNKRKVRNHIGQVHAAAMLLLAETAAVFITALNLQDNKLPLVKKIEGDFVKRSFGDIVATVKLSSEDIALMQSTDKGELAIKVILIDDAGNEPVIVTVTSAWTLKKKV